MFCLDCMSGFDKPSTYYEQYEYWGAPYTKIFYCCPHCNSEYIIENEPPKCDYCGDYCTEQYIKTADNIYYCNNCYQIKDFE